MIAPSGHLAHVGRAANLGLPGAGARAAEHARALAVEVVRARLPISASCAARTVRADIEGWTLERLLRATEEAVGFAVAEGLPVMYVTEDTARTPPQVLERLYTAAIECGARRICLADTVGHATPEGVRRLVRFVRERVVACAGGDVAIPYDHPVVGGDAFRPGTGIHAAAILKAQAKGEAWLADRVYAGVPAALIGRRQRIEISHVSGLSNVKHWLGEHGYDRDDDGLCRHVFAFAKRADRVPSGDEVHACCRAYGAAAAEALRR